MSFHGVIYDWEKCHMHHDLGVLYSTHCKGLRTFTTECDDMHPDALRDGGGVGSIANPFGFAMEKSAWHHRIDLVPVAEAIASLVGYKPEQAAPNKPAQRVGAYADPKPGVAAELVDYAAYIRKNKSQGFTSWQQRYFGSLRNLDLRNLDLRGLSLWGKDMQGCNLEGADLTGASLVDCDLRHVNIRGVVLQGADLSCAKMDGANLSNSDLTDAILMSTSLRGAVLSGAVLSGAKIDRADGSVSSTNLIGARLMGEAVVGQSGAHVTLSGGSIVMLRDGGENWVARPAHGWSNPHVAAAAAALAR
jgi:uncharacterized protein YjbI with pentapeptide repeats